MQTLFNVGKIGMFLDSYTPGIEKRDGEEVKVLHLTLRVQPFDAKLATAIDEGLQGSTNVRTMVFRMDDAGSPKPHLERLNFSLDCPRQNLHIFETPDTEESRVALLQCRMSGFYVRTQKDVSALALVCRATFGPVGRDEWELLHRWYRGQLFVTCEEAEPVLFEEGDAPETDYSGKRLAGVEPVAASPMWDEGDAPAEVTEPVEAPEPAPKPTKRGTRAKTKRHDPEAERRAQAAAAQAASAEA